MPPAPSFECAFRIYWEDTDAGGVVYYANYLKFMERCRTDWLRFLGVDFLRPAILNDEILVTAELVRLSGATILFKQTIRRDDVQLIDATTRVACLDSSTLKPRPIPKDLFTEWRNVE